MVRRLRARRARARRARTSAPCAPRSTARRHHAACRRADRGAGRHPRAARDRLRGDRQRRAHRALLVDRDPALRSRALPLVHGSRSPTSGSSYRHDLVAALERGRARRGGRDHARQAWRRFHEVVPRASRTTDARDRRGTRRRRRRRHRRASRRSTTSRGSAGATSRSSRRTSSRAARRGTPPASARSSSRAYNLMQLLQHLGRAVRSARGRDRAAGRLPPVRQRPDRHDPRSPAPVRARTRDRRERRGAASRSSRRSARSSCSRSRDPRASSAPPTSRPTATSIRRA